MEFRLSYTPQPIEPKIRHSDKIMLVGSCFTEQIGSKFSHHKFSTLENPHGILFNPISIIQALSSYISRQYYNESDLFQNGELWGSWDHHTRFSDLTPTGALEKMNLAQDQAHQFLQKADWLILTLGSAFVYELDNQRVVANCHKVPTDRFNKSLLNAERIVSEFNALISDFTAFNPKLKLIFTISPVRHLRDGFIENNRSKANLINAVHQLTESHSNIYYFPAYELVIDDLRDYRFYAEDMVHPNYLATQYVWEKFCTAAFSAETMALMKDIHMLRLARNHKPFNPSSQQHQEFLKKNVQKMHELSQSHPYLDFKEEIHFMESFLKS